MLVHKGFYSPNLLDVTRTTDEDGNRSEVFTDKEGHKVLERRFLSSIATVSVSSDTYYVYDEYGNLCLCSLRKRRHAISPIPLPHWNCMPTSIVTTIVTAVRGRNFPAQAGIVIFTMLPTDWCSVAIANRQTW